MVHSIVAATAASSQQPSALSGTAAITALLAFQGFLLASVSLSASLGAPGQKRMRKWLLPPIAIAFTSVGLMLILAVAATASWGSVYVGGSLRGPAEVCVAAALIIVIWVQPIIAALLSLGLRVKG